MPLWRPAEPLVLASGSEIRRKILQASGIPLEVQPADLDERAIEEAAAPASPIDTARVLAAAKAEAIAKALPRRIVLGADQTLACKGRAFTKPGNRAAAHRQLIELRGRTHELHSAVCLRRGKKVLFEHVETASLSMRDFSNPFLEQYLDLAGAAASASVGGYQLEGLGIHLFERVEGDYFTILGLPLVPLLGFLREGGYLAV